jgi:hypothetical protein
MLRRRLLIALCMGVALLYPGLHGTPVSAGGSGGLLSIGVYPHSYADVNDPIYVSVLAYYNSCPSGVGYGTASTCADGTPYTKTILTNQEISVSVSTGGILGGTQTYSDGIAYVVTDAQGYGKFTVTSATPGDVTVTVAMDHVNPNSAPEPYSKILTFSPKSVPPPSSTGATPKTSTPAKTTPSTPATPAATPAAARPDIPKPTAFKIANQPVDNMRTFSFKSNEHLTLQGTAVPNGVVKLYIFSTPRQATVTADASGNWSYEVSGLEPGSHHVEAEVTDPKTNATSIRSTFAAFTVTAAPSPLSPYTHPLYWEISGGVLLIVLIATYLKVRIPKPPKIEKAPAYNTANATGIYPGYNDRPGPLKAIPPDIIPEEKPTSHEKPAAKDKPAN